MRTVDRFLNKFIKRLDKIDQESLKNYVLNITREKEFLYTVLHSLPYGVLILDAHGTVNYVNASAKDILMRPESEKSLPCKRIIEDSELYNLIWNNFSGSINFSDAVIDMIKPAVKTVLVSGIPLYTEDHALHAYVIVIRDLHIDEELERSRKAEMFESLTTLAAGLAHEIGNPLNTVNIYLQLIKKELKDVSSKKIVDFVKVITDETQRLDKLVKNFLDVTRSKVSLIRKKSVNEPLENALNFFKPQFVENKISAHIHLDTSIPKFYIDHERLYEAFVNVIKNSIESMPEGGDIWVESTYKDKIVTITMRDSGHGIDTKDLPHIFDAYYSNKENGSGLGLMNVYTVIKAHKGRITVESLQGEGTTFVISLPIRREKLQLPLFREN